MPGVLTDLAERSTPLALHTLAGIVVRGPLSAVGSDFVAVVGPADETVLVPLGAITTVQPEPGSTATIGDRRAPTSSTSFGGALEELGAERPQVSGPAQRRDTVAPAGGARRGGDDQDVHDPSELRPGPAPGASRAS